MEIADGAQVMEAERFGAEMERGGAFKELIHRYTQAFVESLMQSVACNALHSIEKRLARCLLDIRDRVGRNEFPVTQDVLATMLGVRRASVTLAAGTLQKAGLMEHAHKSIIILDPGGLESVACECYALIKGHFARLLP
jgi:CRP-like cAMP-binding protein